MAGSYVSPLSIHNPAASLKPPSTWGDAVNAALDYFDTLIDDAAWTTYGPTVDQGATQNIARTVTMARYQKRGRKFVYNFRLDMTGAGTAGAQVEVDIPVAIFSPGANFTCAGIFQVVDASAGLFYSGVPHILVATQEVVGIAHGLAAAIGAAPNFALAAGDVVMGGIVLESAA